MEHPISSWGRRSHLEKAEDPKRMTSELPLAETVIWKKRPQSWKSEMEAGQEEWFSLSWTMNSKQFVIKITTPFKRQAHYKWERAGNEDKLCWNRKKGTYWTFGSLHKLFMTIIQDFLWYIKPWIFMPMMYLIQNRLPYYCVPSLEAVDGFLEHRILRS